MKNKFNYSRAAFGSLLTIAALLVSTNIASAQVTVAKWTFETLVIAALDTTYTNAPGIITNVPADLGSGTASGFHTSAAAVYSTPVGNGSAKSLSVNNWTNTPGDYWQFVSSTTGNTNISVTYHQTSSGTGPGQFNFFYRTDGVTFTQFGTTSNVLANASPNTVWNGTTVNSAYAYSFDLSSITALNNAPLVYFRVVDASATTPTGGVVGTGGTDRIDNFTILSLNPGSVTISTDLTNKTIFYGDSLNLTVATTGDAPITYRWYTNLLSAPLVDGGSGFGSGVISGATGPSLNITYMDTNQAGSYRVVVSNSINSVTSAVSIVTVNVRPTVVTNIAYLHTQQNANYVLTNGTTLFQVEGVVTTSGNLVTGSPANSFFIQDATGGIDVFSRDGPAIPAAGTVVKITAPIAQFNGLLEMSPTNANPAHKIEVTGSASLPTPALFDFATQFDTAAMEKTNEGRYMVVSNVFLTLTNANGLMSPGGPIFMTNLSGVGFTLLVADSILADPVGYPLPGTPTGPPYVIFASSVRGVISQSDGSAIPTNGYRMYLTFQADIVPGTAPAPVLQFTKSGTDVILTWSDPAYLLQAAPLVTGTYTTIPLSTSPYTNAITGSEQYFRLVK